MAEENRGGRKNSCMSFSKRRHSNSNRSFNKCSRDSTSSTTILAELNEINNAENIHHHLPSSMAGARGVGGAGSAGGERGGRDQVAKRKSSVVSPRTQRVHFSEDSDGYSHSSKHSSADIHDPPPSCAQQLPPAVRPKDLKLCGVIASSGGGVTGGGGGIVTSQTMVKRVGKPQHRFSYMHCDTRGNEETKEACLDRRSSSCPALFNPDQPQDAGCPDRLQVILSQLTAITHELASLTSGPGLPRLVIPDEMAASALSADPGGPEYHNTISTLNSQLELRGDDSPGSSRLTHQLGDDPPSPNSTPTSPTFEEQKFINNVARLNVGGYIFEVTWETLSRIPDSRLGRLAKARSLQQALKHCDDYDPWKHEFYFNYRHRNFEDILTYYSTRSLHISLDSCAIAFVQDLAYWGLSEQCLEPCCLKRYVDVKESLDWDLQNPFNEQDIEVFAPTKCGNFMKTMWNLFEHPSSSIPARFIGFISITCIFVSTVILTLETLPVFQTSEDKFLGEYRTFAIIEAIYMAWFTIEFLVRFTCCPSKLDFIKKLMNWIDLLAIIPYFVTVILHYYGMGIDHLEEVQDSEDQLLSGDLSRTTQYLRLLKLARIIKTLRIIRIFKLARHSTGLQALGNTMRSNYKELGLLFLLLGMGAIMFASLAYVFEKENEDTTFTTMLDAYWWAIITMTTVGYGDVTPNTPIGKLIGCFCAIFGVLVIGLPIPIIGNSFNKFYARQKRWEKREALAANRRAMSLRRKMSAKYLKQSIREKNVGKLLRSRSSRKSDSQQTVQDIT